MPRTPLRMPKMSMTMETGELTVWRVGVGDVVGEGDVVCEVLTDKVDMEVEAPAAGTVVGIDVEVGASVPVGTPLAWIETESDSLIEDLFGPADAAPAPPPAPAPAPAAPPVAPAAEVPAARPWGGPPPAEAPPAPAVPPPAPVAPAASSGPLRAIPGARRLAAAEGLDLASVPGSGPKGAVLLSDVRAALAARGAPGLNGSVAHGSVLVAPAPAAPPAVQAVSVAEDAAPQASPDALWALRAAALAPRPEEAAPAGTVVWRDVTLAAGEPPAPAAVLARVVAGVSAALAERGPAGVAARPRVGIRVATPAGPVTVTVTALHALAPADAEALVADAVGQAGSGRVDVALLAAPDAVVVAVPGADRVAPEVVAPAALAVGVGAASARVVPVGDGLGVRTGVSTSAVGSGWAREPELLAHVLAVVGGRLAG